MRKTNDDLKMRVQGTKEEALTPLIYPHERAGSHSLEVHTFRHQSGRYAVVRQHKHY